MVAVQASQWSTVLPSPMSFTAGSGAGSVPNQRMVLEIAAPPDTFARASASSERRGKLSIVFGVGSRVAKMNTRNRP